MSAQPPQPPDPAQQPPDPSAGLEVELPAGGTLQLQTLSEVELWEQASKRYIEDYNIDKTNDLVLVGAILSQQIILYRAQQAVNGMEPEFDAQGVATGRYVKKQVKQAEIGAAQSTITKASAEIREQEKALGIDKKTREAGGQQTVGQYIALLKRKAHEMGVRINERIIAYERVMNDARWKLRVLENADPEDRRVHNLTPESFIKWLREELDDIEQRDKQWAATKGKTFVGKL